MDLEKACRVLNIDENVLNLENIKRKYKQQALLYHPDKNKSPDAVSRFQEIGEAYDFLLKYHDVEEDPDDLPHDKRYINLLFSFFKNILQENNLVYLMLEKITTACEKTVLDNLQKLNRNVLCKIYEIAKTYKDVLYIDNHFLQKIEEIVLNKKDEFIILNPLLDDLLENNLYKMTVGGNVFIVPLWHTSLVYDNSGSSLYVECIAILPENVHIDDENNVHIDVCYKISDIWKEKIIDVHVGKYIYPLEISLLKLVEEQTVIFVKEGISKINTDDVYDVSIRSNVYIHIKMIL